MEFELSSLKNDSCQLSVHKASYINESKIQLLQILGDFWVIHDSVQKLVNCSNATRLSVKSMLSSMYKRGVPDDKMYYSVLFVTMIVVHNMINNKISYWFVIDWVVYQCLCFPHYWVRRLNTSAGSVAIPLAQAVSQW